MDSRDEDSMTAITCIHHTQEVTNEQTLSNLKIRWLHLACLEGDYTQTISSSGTERTVTAQQAHIQRHHTAHTSICSIQTAKCTEW